MSSRNPNVKTVYQVTTNQNSSGTTSYLVTTNQLHVTNGKGNAIGGVQQASGSSTSAVGSHVGGNEAQGSSWNVPLEGLEVS